MIQFPNAKVNIGLYVTEKRSDGLHNIQTLFFPIKLTDVLEITRENGNNHAEFINSGLAVDGKKEDNLCIKAYRLLSKDFSIPAVRIHLHKIIPFGAGLGGGSSDAAYVLKGLNQFFKLNISSDLLKQYAQKLGSDCAFFIENQTSIGVEKGNVLSPFEINLSNYFMVIVHPQIHVSTKEAYSQVTPQIPAISLDIALKMPISEWKNHIYNDFEKSIFPQYPEIESIKQQLYNSGAIYASMTGSGSAVFGIFEQKPKLQTLFQSYFYWEGECE